MASFGARGVPALAVGEDATRRMLPSSALFGGLDALTARLQAVGHSH
jgi:protein-disulfide isomerase-like protein with CxxC motif